MHELMQAALQGVDPTSPGAFLQIFRNLLLLMPWWWLFWSNLVCVIVAWAIAHWRGSNLGRAVAWALVLGPFGWIITWYARPATRLCPRCGAVAKGTQGRCGHCGCQIKTSTTPT
ncbi:MAG: hypothetical protein L0H70_00900 [Xanthomonadales bacterium]|nr:hypothetical protein [Xanthomonadales bacterium]